MVADSLEASASTGFARGIGEYGDFGVRELFVEAVALHVARDQQQRVLAHLFRERIPTAKPLQRDGSGVVADERLEDAPAKASAPRGERAAEHARHEGRAGSYFEAPNRLQAASIVVAHRKVKEQVRDRAQVAPREALGALRTDTVQGIRRILELLLGPRRLGERAQRFDRLAHTRGEVVFGDNRERLRDPRQLVFRLARDRERGRALGRGRNRPLEIADAVELREVVPGGEFQRPQDRDDRRLERTLAHLGYLASARTKVADGVGRRWSGPPRRGDRRLVQNPSASALLAARWPSAKAYAASQNPILGFSLLADRVDLLQCSHTNRLRLHGEDRAHRSARARDRRAVGDPAQQRGTPDRRRVPD